jgi:preprotein translocase subunit SecE
MEPNASKQDLESSEQRTGRNRIERLRLFLSESRNELKRVTWPSRREVYATTIVVIATSVVLGLYSWGIDVLLDRLEFWIFGWTSQTP